MKNKSRKIIFWGLACILALSLGLSAEAADNHSHFDAEKIKPGVGFFESYRSQAAIDRDVYSDSKCAGSTLAGFPNHPYYNPSQDPYIDGAVIPVVPLECMAQLRNSFSNMNNKSDIWIQYELRVDQDFISDGPFSTWQSMKLFRIADLTKSTCPVNQVLETMNISTEAGHIGTHGGYCGSTDQALHAPRGNAWDRITWRFWFAGKRMQIWSTNLATGVTTQVLDQPVSYPSTGTVTGAWPILHSTERSHNGSGDQTETYHIGYRNIIVSTQPISFGSGASTPACSSNADCSDGNLCNGTETCSSGTCLSGTPVKTDDGVACTADSCNPSTGQVTHSPNNNLCADTSPCTTNERCDATQGCLKTTISQCANSDGCCPSGCTAANDSDCGTTQPSGSLLIDFANPHVYGMTNWTTLLKDSYTKYYDLGPGGMTGSTNASYNYQGVQGSVSKYFAKDDRIIATWYNAGTSSITITPYVSFNDPDRRLSDTAGNWYLMSALTLSPGQTGTTQFIFDQTTQGNHALVNINSNYGSGTPELICDKIEYKSSTTSSGTPGDLNSDGKVDIFDYSLFISNFGKTGTGLAADLNSDGKVDIFDYSIFISNFGK